MRVHLILDLRPDPQTSTHSRPGAEQVVNELENELESSGLEVDGITYDVHVLGSGRTSSDAASSMRLRRNGGRS